MAQKIRVTNAEETDWYSIGEIYEISPVQRYVTIGVEVGLNNEEEEKTNALWIVKHGDYEECVDIKLATTTEEQLFTIVLLEDQLQGNDISFLEQSIQTINQKTNIVFPWSELQWTIDVRSTVPDNGYVYVCQTFKDSHLHINTTAWMKACQDFVCELQALLKLETIKAYSQPIKLYTFTKN